MNKMRSYYFMSNRERNIYGNLVPEFSNVVLEKDGEDSWTDCMRNA
jgi:hypothetical protein